MKRIHIIAYIFVLLSLIIAPAIVFTAPGSAPGGLDCTDSSWIGTPRAEVIKYYEAISHWIGGWSLVMIAIGIVILVVLSRQLRGTGKTAKSVIPIVLVIIMLLGYLLLLGIGSEFC